MELFMGKNVKDRTIRFLVFSFFSVVNSFFCAYKGKALGDINYLFYECANEKLKFKFLFMKLTDHKVPHPVNIISLPATEHKAVLFYNLQTKQT